jgi:hypothetical protein
MLAMLLDQEIIPDEHDGVFTASFGPPLSTEVLGAHQRQAEGCTGAERSPRFAWNSQQYTDSVFFTHERPATWRLEEGGTRLIIPEAGDGTSLHVSRRNGAGQDWAWVLTHPRFLGLRITSEALEGFEAEVAD